jgi:hypothetical protein
MIEKKTKGDRLLEIDNTHVADCGPPPSFDAADKYLGYFESYDGDQWVFIGDRKTGEAVVRGGDAGWQTEFKVALKRPYPADLVLNEPEKRWIITCFAAMCDAAYDAVASDFATGEAMSVAAALSEVLDAKLADRQRGNGANGNHPKEERPGE